jgi:hypothetical protein
MKKKQTQTRKLTLNKETMRKLTNSELGQVFGADITDGCQSVDNPDECGSSFIIMCTCGGP